jgi:GNAT superfamily N-acetyltransferase
MIADVSLFDNELSTYTIAIKAYSELLEKEKIAIMEMLYCSFVNNSILPITKAGILGYLKYTTSFVLYNNNKIVGYCAISRFNSSDMTCFIGKQYITFGIFWLCIEPSHRNQGLALRLIDYVCEVTTNYARINKINCLLFGEFNNQSAPLIKRLWCDKSQLIIGCNHYTPLGLELAMSYAAKWSRTNCIMCSSNRVGMLSNNREIIGLLINR